jgi:hypothetical protein
MKKILLPTLLLLAACSPPTPLKVEEADKPTADVLIHLAVSDFVRSTADDPASYQPARWGTPRPWQQKDASKIAADTLLPALTKARTEADRLAAKWASAKAKGHSTTASWRSMMVEADTAYLKLYKQKFVLSKSRDTTRLGSLITHAYRAKNKMGALQLDSAQFIVYKNGKVEKL